MKDALDAGPDPAGGGRIQQARTTSPPSSSPTRTFCRFSSGQRRAGNHAGHARPQRPGTGGNAPISGDPRPAAPDRHHGGNAEALPIRSLRLAGNRYRRPHRRICFRGHRIQLLYAGAPLCRQLIAARRTACASAPKRRKPWCARRSPPRIALLEAGPAAGRESCSIPDGPGHARKKAFCGQLEALLLPDAQQKNEFPAEARYSSGQSPIPAKAVVEKGQSRAEQRL